MALNWKDLGTITSALHAPVGKRHFAWLALCHVHSITKPDSQKEAEELKA